MTDKRFVMAGTEPGPTKTICQAIISCQKRRAGLCAGRNRQDLAVLWRVVAADKDAAQINGWFVNQALGQSETRKLSYEEANVLSSEYFWRHVSACGMAGNATEKDGYWL